MFHTNNILSYFGELFDEILCFSRNRRSAEFGLLKQVHFVLVK